MDGTRLGLLLDVNGSRELAQCCLVLRVDGVSKWSKPRHGQELAPGFMFLNKETHLLLVLFYIYHDESHHLVAARLVLTIRMRVSFLPSE